MNSETIVMCVVALILGMLMANMLKSVCGCKVVEGQGDGLPRCEGFFRTRLCSNVTDLSDTDTGCNNHVETLGGRNRQCGIISESNYVNPEQLNKIGTCGRIREPGSTMRPEDRSYPVLQCNAQDIYIAEAQVEPDNRVESLSEIIFTPYLDCIKNKIFDDDGTIKVENSNEDIKKLVRQGSYNEENEYIIPTGSLEECFTNLNKSIDENLVSENSVLASTAPNEPCRALANTSPVIDFMFDGQCGLDGAICDWQDESCIIVDENELGETVPNDSWAMCKEQYFSNWKNDAGNMKSRQCYDSLDTVMPIWLENTYNDLFDAGSVTSNLGGRYINYTTSPTGY
jgi:hypothetical protein